MRRKFLFLPLLTLAGLMVACTPPQNSLTFMDYSVAVTMDGVLYYGASSEYDFQVFRDADTFETYFTESEYLTYNSAFLLETAELRDTNFFETQLLACLVIGDGGCPRVSASYTIVNNQFRFVYEFAFAEAICTDISAGIYIVSYAVADIPDITNIGCTIQLTLPQ